MFVVAIYAYLTNKIVFVIQMQSVPRSRIISKNYFAGQKKKEQPHFQLDFNDCYIPSKVFPMGWVQTTPLEWTIAYSNTQQRESSQTNPLSKNYKYTPVCHYTFFKGINTTSSHFFQRIRVPLNTFLKIINFTLSSYSYIRPLK